MNAIDLTETLVDTQGNPYASQTVIIENLDGPSPDDALGLVGVTRVALETDASGLLEANLVAGRYAMRWQIGTVRSEWEFCVPYTGGPYQIRYLGVGRQSQYAQGWRFAGINQALLQLRNATTSGWHSVIIDASAGSDALTLGIAADGDEFDGPNWKEDSGCLFLYAPTGGTWHAITILGSAGSPQIAYGAAGVSVANNHRIRNGRRQFLNTDTGLYHSLFLTGSTGAVTHAIGPGEP